MRTARETIVEVSGLVDAEERDGLIAWAEQRLAPWPVGANAPEFFRCVVEDGRLVGLVGRLSGRLGRNLRVVGAAFVDRFDAGQRLLPTPGGCTEGLVVVVALNGGYAGGEAVCYPAAGPRPHALPAGSALVFPAYMTAEDMPTREGRRYVLRMVVADAPG